MGTSIRFGVLCRFTAFVAAHREVVNAGGKGHQLLQPVESPAGWVPSATCGMGLQMRLSPRLDQRTVLAPRMIQSMEILQLSTADLHAKIERELQENPFLEQSERHGDLAAPPGFNPDAPLQHDTTGNLEFSRLDELNRDWDNYFNEESQRTTPARTTSAKAGRKLDAIDNKVSRPPSLQDHLAEQLGELELDEEHRLLAKHICGFIDCTGYLGTREKASEDDDRDTFRPVSLAEIAASYAVLITEQDFEEMLVDVVQKLEPAGVGARDLKECLLLQITADTPCHEALRVLVRDHLEDIAKNRISVIQKATKFGVPRIREAIDALHHVDPKPGLMFADMGTPRVRIDVIVERFEDDGFDIRLTEQRVWKVRTNRRMVKLLKTTNLDIRVKEELRKQLQSADWLVKAVEQRRDTLLKVARVIIEHQRPFLTFDSDHIQPLKMQQIADEVRVHITTVNRAVDNKRVQTPRGVFPLKRFFGGKRNKTMAATTPGKSSTRRC